MTNDRPSIAVNEISAEELMAKLQANELLTLIDLRLAWEYTNNGHIPTAVNISISQFAKRLDEIPKDRPVILQCVHGKNSGKAFQILADAGWDMDKVLILQKGIGGWIRAHGRKTLV